MNVTPTDRMFAAMQKFTDTVAGEDPGKSKGTNASKIRERRLLVMNFLHSFCALSMRHGAARRDEEVRQQALERSQLSKIRSALNLN